MCMCASNRFTVTIKKLTSKETFHNNLTHVLRLLCSDSSRMTTGSPLSNQGTPAGRRTFPLQVQPYLRRYFQNFGLTFHS